VSYDWLLVEQEQDNNDYKRRCPIALVFAVVIWLRSIKILTKLIAIINEKITLFDDKKSLVWRICGALI